MDSGDLPKRVYSAKTRQLAVQLAQNVKENGSCVVRGTEVYSLRELAKILQIQNEATLRYWIKQGDWRKEAVERRSSKRGTKSKLSTEQLDKIENYVIGCQSNHEHCGAEEVIKFCNEVSFNIYFLILQNFQWSPSKSWVSTFLKSRSIRSHAVQKFPAKRNR
jgi:hypothetical protein